MDFSKHLQKIFTGFKYPVEWFARKGIVEMNKTNLKATIEMSNQGYHDHVRALVVVIKDIHNGYEVDRAVFKFNDIFKSELNPNHKLFEIIEYCIKDPNEDIWYINKPTQEDLQRLTNEIERYISSFDI